MPKITQFSKTGKIEESTLHYLGYEIKVFRLNTYTRDPKTGKEKMGTIHYKVIKPGGGYMDFTSKKAAKEWIKARVRGPSRHPQHKTGSARRLIHGRR